MKSGTLALPGHSRTGWCYSKGMLACGTMLPGRRILSAFSVFFALILLLPTAHASIARALRLAELVKASEQVIVGVPVEAWSRWEEVASSRRIVTYTRVRVEETVGGAPRESEVLVRTLGGQVDKIGQVVYGEAILSPGERSLLFLHQASDGKTLVTGMAQGHFPLKARASAIERAPSRSLHSRRTSRSL